MEQEERYNQIWNCGDVQRPEAWSVWKIIKDFKGKKNLEIGPGNWPKIPIKGGYFLDISKTCIRNLKKSGAKAIVGDATNLPFKNNFFDLVVAIEVLEHIEDDRKAIAEIARVLKPSGFFLFSVPLRMDLYSEVDRIFGHKRRYEVEELKAKLSEGGFKILKYRHPSLYLKMINKGITFLHLKKRIYESSGTSSFRMPKFLLNLYAKGLAFLDKRGAPKWQEDVENLSGYKDRGIALFCQKIKGIK